jgi:hypothetical protein
MLNPQRIEGKETTLNKTGVAAGGSSPAGTTSLSDVIHCNSNDSLGVPPSPSHCKGAGLGSGEQPPNLASPALPAASAQEQVLLRAGRGRGRAQQLSPGGIAGGSPNITPIAAGSHSDSWEIQAECQAVSAEGGIPFTLPVFRDL